MDDIDEFFLDLLTYTDPVSGKKRCALNACLEDINDGMQKRIRVTWLPIT